MKKIFTLILSLALMQSFGQTESRLQVIASGGGDYTDVTSGLSISWTLGEPVIATLTNTGANLMLTQGFQQGFSSILTVSTNTLTVAATANSTTTFDITSNINWTVSSNQTWLSVSSGSGTGNSTITLTATANPNNSLRSAIVTVAGTGATSQTITVSQDASTGIDEIGNGNTITMYPNPATNKVWFKVNNQTAKGAFIVEIYDITGRKIINEDLGQFVNQDLKGITVSSLKAGIYFIKVKIGTYNSDVIRLMKE